MGACRRCGGVRPCLRFCVSREVCIYSVHRRSGACQSPAAPGDRAGAPAPLVAPTHAWARRRSAMPCGSPGVEGFPTRVVRPAASRPPPAVSPRRARARPVRLGLSSPIGGVVSAIIDVLMYAQAVFSPSEVFAVYPFAHPPFFISHHVTVLGPAPNSTALWEKCIPWGSQKSARHTSS
jgi:hypothetical protein